MSSEAPADPDRPTEPMRVLVRSSRPRDDESISVIATVEDRDVHLLDYLMFGTAAGRIIRIEAYGFVHDTADRGHSFDFIVTGVDLEQTSPYLEQVIDVRPGPYCKTQET